MKFLCLYASILPFSDLTFSSLPNSSLKKMSSCLSGGGRAYRLNLDLIKPHTSYSTSNSSSPSSTLSESSNSPLSIFTRKPRKPRKRPNQTYNEAAAILSTAHPKIFPLTKPFKFRKSLGSILPEPADLLPYPPVLEPRSFSLEQKRRSSLEKPCRSPGEVNSQGNYPETCDDYHENFDTEAIMDQEIGEGIDSIMGNPTVENESSNQLSSIEMNACCYGFPVYGMRRELRGMRNGNEDWWRFPTVNVAEITRKIAEIPVEKKKKKKKKKNSELGKSTVSEEPVTQSSARLGLKLNYDDVLNAWSDKGSPFSGDAPVAESGGNNVQERLAQINLFPAERDAIVLRYQDKRRVRLFSNKINDDQRPRIKGRFVRREKSVDDD